MASHALARAFPENQPERQNRFDTLGRRFVRMWEDQSGLDKPAGKLAGIVKEQSQMLPGGQKTVDLLNGTLLGHPLHPVLTDLPIGAFTFAAMFDAATRACALAIREAEMSSIARVIFLVVCADLIFWR